jgi:uncharacterized membrane protein YfhO
MILEWLQSDERADLRGRSTQALLTLGLFGVVYRDFVLQRALYVYTDSRGGYDTINQYWPLLTAMSRNLRSGDFSFWTFNIGVGTDWFSVPTFFLDPFNLVYGLVPPEQVVHLLVWVHLLKLLVAGDLFHRWLRTFSIDRYSTVVIGLFFVFSGYFVLWGQHYQFGTRMVLLAGTLYGFETWLRKGRPAPFLIFTALACTLSIVVSFHLALLFLVYAPIRIVQESAGDRGLLARKLATAAALALLAGGLAAWAILPYVYLLQSSPRISAPSSVLGDFGVQSLHFYRTLMMRLFSSEALGTAHLYTGWRMYFSSPVVYVGLPFLLLFPQFVLGLAPRRRRFVLALVLLVIPFFVFPRLAELFLLFNKLSYRWTYLLIPFQLLATAYALQRLRKVTPPHRKTLIATTVVLCAALYAGYDPQAGFPLEDGAPVASLLRGVALLICVYTAVVLLMASRRRSFDIAFGLVVVMEIILISSTTVNRELRLDREELDARVHYNDYSLDAIRFIQRSDSSFYRILKTSCSVNQYYCGDPIFQDFRGVRGFISLQSGGYLRFLDSVSSYGHDPKTLPDLLGKPEIASLLSSRYAVCRNLCPEAGGEWALVETFPDDIRVYRNDNALPLAFAYERQISEGALARHSKDVRVRAMLNAAIVGEPVAGITVLTPPLRSYEEQLPRLRGAALEIEHFANDAFSGSITLERPAILFASIPHHEGWRITIDGQPTETLRVHYGFVGVAIPEGRHEVAFRFTPHRLGEGLVISGLSLTIAVGWWGTSRRRIARQGGDQN